MDITLATLVADAQRGDLDAFGQVVGRCQALAHAVAYTVVGDTHLAQDAAQEAFIEAYLNLAALREPAAFPGWFRRVVLKCADRLVRGKSFASVPFDSAAPLASAQPGPAEQAETRELRRRLLQALAALPEHQRQVALLFYLAGYPQNEIAALLELPLTTVKKRLFDARRRMRQQLDDLVRDVVRERRPAPGPQFARLVKFFIAVRTGDLERVRVYLEADPALVRAQERWDEATARRYGLPVIVGLFTGLHRAVYNRDAALAGLLLAAGADPNARAAFGQTPLHLAVQLHAPALVELLLAAGAVPSPANEVGITPLHCAAILGHADLAGLLLAHAANPRAADRHGRTPREWAELKGRADVLAAFDTEG